MSQKIKLFIVGVCCLTLFAACSPKNEKTAVQESSKSVSSENKAVYHKISAEEAKKMMEEEHVMIVDVRTAEEYAEKHIPGAILVPNETIGQESPKELPDKKATLLIYCRSGNRSRQAAEKLLDLGYENVYDFGGIKDWTYETESGESK